MATRTARGRRVRAVVILVLAMAVLFGAVVGGKALWNTAKNHFTSNSCTFGQYEVDTGQASVAATMVGAVTRFPTKLPERAAVLAIAGALQESKLRNIAPGDGDRDSVGVLQQRPSQGWGNGSAQTLTDVGEATTEFLQALVKIDGWQGMSAAEAIQKVQISADGSLYAQHEAQAKAMSDALLGRTAAGVTCEFDAPSKVATPTKVVGQMRTELGIDTPQVSGNGVRVPGGGWQSAAWFVANADRLGIAQVSYQGKKWTRTGGWTNDTGAPASAVTATLARV